MSPDAAGHASASGHPECYGSMFPNVLALPEDRPTSGRVFSVMLTRAGGMWRSRRSVTADSKQWGECLKCDGFEGCYKLSMAKLALESAVQDQ